MAVSEPSAHMEGPIAARSALSGWSRFRLLLGHGRHIVILLVVGSVLSGLAEAGLLAVLAQSAAALVVGASEVPIEIGPLSSSVPLGPLLGLAVALAFTRLALQVLVSYVPALIAADTQALLRTRLLDAFTRASWSMQSRDREGHLQELASNHVLQAAQGALQATTLVVAASAFAVLVLSALALNVVAALAVLAVAIVLLLALRPLGSMGRHRALALSRASIDYAGEVNEAVRLTEEVRVFGVSGAQRERLNRLIARVRRAFFETQLFVRLVMGVYQSLIYLLIAAALAVLYAAGTGQIASLGAVVLLLVRAGTYGQQAQGAYQAVRQALPFVERLQEAEQRYIDSAPSEGAKRLKTVQTIIFDEVSFSYEPGRPVLADISFEVTRGEAIGIIGPSGAGKSTLVQILLGLRTPDTGFYRINGMPPATVIRADWHRQFAYVPQEPRVIHASVADNIRFFRSFDAAAIERAAALAGIHDDIAAWPKGYNTMIGPRADGVSGGQQQRICIARALASEPTVLVLDEPTSALDARSETLIQESLTDLKGAITLFVVAHRISTLSLCDRIMVIDNGRLQAFDHVEALETHNEYFRTAKGLGGSASLSI
jgi:ATP-binding cassette subfamily B protein